MAEIVRVLFSEDFDFHPLPGQTVAYLAGQEYPVSEAVAEKAEAAGAGVRVASEGDDGREGQDGEA